MAKILTEDDIEKGLVSFLTGAGWGYREINAMTADRAALPDGTERTDKKLCVLPEVLRESLKRLNPSVPDGKLSEIAAELAEYRGADGLNLATNRELYELLRNGKSVEFTDAEGDVRSEIVRIIDFDAPLTVAINGRKSLGIVMKPDAGIAATTDDNRLSSTNTEIE